MFCSIVGKHEPEAGYGNHERGEMAMNATRNARRLLTALAGLAAAHGAASEIYVGTGDTVRHDVAADAAQTENVVVAPRGTLLKTGEGTWTLPTSKIMQGWGADLAVDQGALKIRSDAAPATTGFETPPAVMQNAAVWFDTRKADSFVRDGSDNITDWLDRRETGNANGGYAYVRAHTDNTVTNLYPELKAKDGTTGLYFQGYKSGCFMNLLTPAGGQATLLTYNVFAVQGQFEKYAPLFGCRKGINGTAKLAFVPGNASGAFVPFWTFYNHDTPNMHAARTYIDGSEVDAFKSDVALFPNDRFALLEVEFLDGPGGLQCFFNDRDFWASRNIASMNYNTGAGDRVGGEYICEVVAFTNTLTAAERLQVEGYLMAKWFGVKRPASLSVNTAVGTQVEIEVEEGGESFPMSFGGGGDLVVNGTGEHFLDTISLLDGFTGCLRLGSGSLMTKASQTMSASAGVELSMAESYDGQTLSRASAAADTFVKSGTGTMRVNALPAAVKKLQVTGGELALEAPRTPNFTAVADPSAVVTGYVPNASFEIGVGATTETINLGTTTGYQGWTAVAGEGATIANLAWINHSAYKGGKNASSIYWNLPTEVPDGESVLAINKGASVWTTITLPQEGVYELTFKGSVREGKYGLILELAVGSDAESLETFGYFRAIEPKTKYYSYRYLLPRLAAGSYQLWFRQVDNSQDRCSLIDDVKLTRIPDSRLCEEVPNGSFENFKGAYADFPTPTKFLAENFNALADWTIVQAPTPSSWATSSSANYAGSGPVLRGMCQASRTSGSGWTGQFYNQREGDDGCVQLYLMAGATASVTFTPPAGRYFVEADVGLWRTTQDSSIHMEASTTITPEGGEAVSLGTIDINREYTLKRRRFPNAFSADGATAITLTLGGRQYWQETTKTGYLLYDNVRLVPVDSFSGENLIANGSFSVNTGWSYYNRSGLSDGSYKPKQLAKSEGNITAFGANWLDSYCLLVVDNGLVTQQISVQEAGRYRLQVAARKRVSWDSPTAKATDPIRFWIARGGETNEIARFEPTVTNFTMYSWAFNVPAAGNDWTFGIDGLGTAGNDMNTLLDNISIVREPLAADAPEMDEELVIRVAADAKLRLDFPGTNHIKKLVLGGRSYHGIVSARDVPEYLSGDGALCVATKGTMMIIR